MTGISGQEWMMVGVGSPEILYAFFGKYGAVHYEYISS